MTQQNWRANEQKATSTEEARKILEKDFFVTGPSGIVYEVDMLNQAAFARLMSKMEGTDQKSITKFVMDNLVELSTDLLPDIVITPKIGEDGIPVEKVPPADLNIIFAAFMTGPSAKKLEDDESFRGE